MRRKRTRGLSAEDRKIWDEVRRSVTPLSPQRKKTVTETPNPKPKISAGPSPALTSSPEPPVPKPVIRPKAAPTVKLDRAPSLTEQLDAAPRRMDRKAFLRLKRGKTPPEATIDLHGMTLAQAHPALTRFLLDARTRGFRTVLVITGKGRASRDEGPIPERRGVLKHQVPQWLSSAPLAAIVQQVTEAHLRHGGSGAYYVRLRRSGS